MFIHLFRSGKYLTANSMYESRKLKWSRRKVYDTYDYYKLYYSFKSDRRHSNSFRGEKLSDKESLKCFELLEKNNIFSIKISNILCEENLADVSKTRIVNALKKLGYECKTSKIKIKNLEPHTETRYNWCLLRINSTYFHGIFFSDKCTFYLNNLMHQDEWKMKKKILFFKRQRKKSWSLGSHQLFR